MSGVADEERIVADARELLARTRDQLELAKARDEALATFVPPRRVLLVMKKSAMVPVGRVWRLGVLLLGRDGTLYATGSTTRVAEPGRAAYQSVSAEIRREYRDAAFRGPFARGETVNYDAQPIALEPDGLLSSGPLFLHRGHVMVRWNATAGDGTAIEFGAYLADRAGLLLDPPEGA